MNLPPLPDYAFLQPSLWTFITDFSMCFRYSDELRPNSLCQNFTTGKKSQLLYKEKIENNIDKLLLIIIIILQIRFVFWGGISQ